MKMRRETPFTRMVKEVIRAIPRGRVDLKRFQREPNDGAAGRSPSARKFLRELTKPQ